MRTPATCYPELSMPLWRWSLALLLVCGFGIFAIDTQQVNSSHYPDQTHFITTADIPLAYSENLTTAKRPHQKPGKDEEGKQFWAETLVKQAHNLLFSLIYPLSAFPENTLLSHTVSHQPRNPRAPPLV